MPRLRCPENLDVIPIHIPPYFYQKSNDTNGRSIFEDILKDTVSYCCRDKTNSTTFLKTFSRYDSYEEFLRNSSVDIILPVFGDPEKRYMDGRPFIPLGEY